MQGSVQDLVTFALKEIRSARAGDVANPDDMADGLVLLNEMLDQFNAAPSTAIFNRAPFVGTLTPNLNPHTIGTSGATFTVTTGAPAAVLQANLIVNNNIRRPLALRDASWRMKLPTPAITSSESSDLYYEHAWPIGKLWLYPVPSAANQLELLLSTLFASVLLTDTYDLPYGYPAALRLLLAKKMSPSWGQSWSPLQQSELTRACGLAFGDNTPIPAIVTRDGGMPSLQGSGYFEYRTGFLERR